MNNTTSNSEKGSAGSKAVPVAEKVRKSRRGGEVHEPPPYKFYIGEVKDGVPVLGKEVSESDALIDGLISDRPFMSVQLWKTVKQPDGGRVVLTKAPLATK